MDAAATLPPAIRLAELPVQVHESNLSKEHARMGRREVGENREDAQSTVDWRLGWESEIWPEKLCFSFKTDSESDSSVRQNLVHELLDAQCQ